MIRAVTGKRAAVMPSAHHTSSMEDFLSARCLCYTCLERIFGEEMSPEAVKCLAGREVAEAFRLATGHDGAAHCASLEGLVRKASQDFASYGDRWRSDYMRLFIVPGKASALPWESAWALGDRTLFGPCTLDVRERYRRAGLAVGGKGTVADDHISLELGYMKHMAIRLWRAFSEKDSGAFSNLASEQLSFLEEHLLKWAPLFCEYVESSDEDGLYGRSAGLLSHMLNEDRSILGSYQLQQN